jgi:hypothetical protein
MELHALSYLMADWNGARFQNFVFLLPEFDERKCQACASLLPELCTVVMSYLCCGGMSLSICDKTTTLIFLDCELVHHFIDGTGIGSSTTAFNAAAPLYCTCSCSVVYFLIVVLVQQLLML